MPYQPISQLRLPPDDATIWRYMDLWKLEAMVSGLSLFFVRSDNFTDPWDSKLPPDWESTVNVPMISRPSGGTYTIAEWYREREIPSNPIHCWNCDDAESSRMWNEYTSSAQSVVIKSTVGKLKKIFSHTERNIMIGLIEYGDHSNIPSPRFVHSQWGESIEEIQANPWYVPRWFKRPDFRYEKELRATTHVSQRTDPFEKGFSVLIGQSAVAELIQSIRLHPAASLDFGDGVRELLFDNGFEHISVGPSALT